MSEIDGSCRGGFEQGAEVPEQPTLVYCKWCGTYQPRTGPVSWTLPLHMFGEVAEYGSTP